MTASAVLFAGAPVGSGFLGSGCTTPTERALSAGVADIPDSIGEELLLNSAVPNPIVSGGAHKCALPEGGAVKCWGDNSAGQLGVGDVATRGDAPGELGSALPSVNLGDGAAGGAGS